MRQIISYLTLKFVSSEFRDTVTGKMVCLYRDKYGNEFLKDGRWSLFSVAK